MGLMENLGRVATSYMDEKAKLQEAGEKRKRTRMDFGHMRFFVTPFFLLSWPPFCCFTHG